MREGSGRLFGVMVFMSRRRMMDNGSIMGAVFSCVSNVVDDGGNKLAVFG